MFKKIFNLSMLGVVASIILPVMVDASTFENGHKKYGLESISNTCSLNSDAEIYGTLNSEKKIVLIDNNEDTTNKKEYYIMDENGVCDEMTVQQILDYNNQPHYFYRIDEDYKYNKYKYVFLERGYVSAKGTTYSEDIIYRRMGDNGAIYALDGPSSAEEIDDYYMLAPLSYPTEAVIDEDITYYTLAGGGRLDEVLNPIVEDMYMYYYYDSSVNDEHELVETIATITDPVLTSYIDAEEEHNIICFSSEGKNFITLYDYDGIMIYDISGNIIDIDLGFDYEIMDIKFIDSMYLLTLVEISEIDMDSYSYKIFNSDGDILDSSDSFVLANDYFRLNNGEVILLGGNPNNKCTPYLLREYKLLTDDNLTYDNENMTFRFSGDHNNVATVKVNDVELDEKDYTITKGSTIVTLKRNYLNSLSTGDYVLKVTYNNSIELTSNFEVNNINNPQTGDGIMNYIFIGSISLIGLLGTSIYLNKKIFN